MIHVQRQRPSPQHLGTIRPIRSLTIVVAVDNAGGFGKDGKIPWHFSEDFKHFKETTKGGICIMGRKTYEDMLALVKKRQKKKKAIKEILPGRTCYVLTRQENYEAEGAMVAASLIEAVQSIPEEDTREVFIIGGEKLYIESLAWVDKVHLTLVDGYYDCDRFFPVDTLKEKFEIVDGKKGKDEKLMFVEYKRTKQ